MASCVASREGGQPALYLMLVVGPIHRSLLRFGCRECGAEAEAGVGCECLEGAGQERSSLFLVPHLPTVRGVGKVEEAAAAR